MSPEERSLRPILAEIFAIILLIPFLTLFFVAFALNLAQTALETPPVILFPGSVPILLAYGILPIIYCTIVSLYLRPKRIVSPIYVQIGTMAAYSLMVIYATFSRAIPTLIQIENLAANLLLLMMLAISVGMAQFFVVRWWVALNFEGMYRESYLVNGNSNDVMETLGQDFCSSWLVRNQEYNPKSKNPIWIMRHRMDNVGNYVIVAIGSLGNDKNKSVVALAAFRKNIDTISISPQATQRLVSMKNDIDERLGNKDVLLSLMPLASLDDSVSKTVNRLAKTPTISRIDIMRRMLREIPHSYIYAFIFTALVLVIVTIAYMVKPFDFGAYISIVAATVLSMIAEIGIPLRDELRTHKIEELD